VKLAKEKMAEEEMQEEYEKYLANVTAPELVLDNLTYELEQLQKLKERKVFILEHILSNSSFWVSRKELLHVLLHSLISQRITSATKWKASFDGLSLKYFSAALEPAQEGESSGVLHIVSQTLRAGDLKRNQTIMQPLSYVRLESVEYLDTCSADD
jgi:hypothetical protein